MHLYLFNQSTEPIHIANTAVHIHLTRLTKPEQFSIRAIQQGHLLAHVIEHFNSRRITIQTRIASYPIIHKPVISPIKILLAISIHSAKSRSLFDKSPLPSLLNVLHKLLDHIEMS